MARQWGSATDSLLQASTTSWMDHHLRHKSGQTSPSSQHFRGIQPCQTTWRRVREAASRVSDLSTSLLRSFHTSLDAQQAFLTHAFRPVLRHRQISVLYITCQHNLMFQLNHHHRVVACFHNTISLRKNSSRPNYLTCAAFNKTDIKRNSSKCNRGSYRHPRQCSTNPHDRLLKPWLLLIRRKESRSVESEKIGGEGLVNSQVPAKSQRTEMLAHLDNWKGPEMGMALLFFP